MSARHYGKIHGSFWTSPTIRALGDDGRTLAAYLLTSPHTTMLGCFRAPDAYVSEDVGWPPERVRSAFDILHRNGFATRDEGFWVVIHRFLFWNRIENQNQGKAAMRAFVQLPESAKPSVARGLAQFGDWVRQDVLRPFLGNGFGTVLNPGSGSGSGSEAGTGSGTGTGSPDLTTGVVVTQIGLPGTVPARKPAKVPKPKAPKPEPVAAPGRAELIDHYFVTFEKARGTRPLAFSAREGKSINKLLDLLGLDAAKRIIDGAFADRFRKITINDIAADPDRFTPAKPLEPELSLDEQIARGLYPKPSTNPLFTMTDEELRAHRRAEIERRDAELRAEGIDPSRLPNAAPPFTLADVEQLAEDEP